MKQRKSKISLISAALTLAAGALCLFLAAGCSEERKNGGSGVVLYHTPAGSATPGNSTAASADRSSSPITESTVSASTQASEATPVPTQTPTPAPTPTPVPPDEAHFRCCPMNCLTTCVICLPQTIFDFRLKGPLLNFAGAFLLKLFLFEILGHLEDLAQSHFD